jgi:hypothetical protein
MIYTYGAMRLAIEDIDPHRWPLPPDEVLGLLNIDDRKLRDARRALKIRYKKSDGIYQNEALKIAAWMAYKSADHEQRAPLMRGIVTHRLGAWRG